VSPSASDLGADVVNDGDVGVVERRGCFGLLLEARQALGLRGELGGQHLDRDLAPEACVLREVHRAHAAGAEGFEDLVGTERFADQE